MGGAEFGAGSSRATNSDSLAAIERSGSDDVGMLDSTSGKEISPGSGGAFGAGRGSVSGGGRLITHPVQSMESIVATATIDESEVNISYIGRRWNPKPPIRGRGRESRESAKDGRTLRIGVRKSTISDDPNTKILRLPPLNGRQLTSLEKSSRLFWERKPHPCCEPQV